MRWDGPGRGPIGKFLTRRMMSNFLYALLATVVVVNAASAAYVLIAIWRVRAFGHRKQAVSGFRPPVTVLKPICGLDSNLYDNLRSFCLQDYPEWQIVFGVRDAADPAIPMIEKLIREFPDNDMFLVVNGVLSGPNLKVSNLENMSETAKHPHLIIADSDMRVDPTYLDTIIAPFANNKVGVVTCLYKGTPSAGFASQLAGMHINEWFLPSVLVSAGLKEIRFGLGATMAVRKDVLEAIGGFTHLAQYLADDHMLGKWASALGFKVVLSDYIVENIVHENDLKSLFRHELRWARTVRAVAPAGHAFSFIMYGVPLALALAVSIEAVLGWGVMSLSVLALPVALRVWLHLAACRTLGRKVSGRAMGLIPLRDLLSFMVLVTSFFDNKIEWKGRMFTVDNDGLMKAVERQ